MITGNDHRPSCGARGRERIELPQFADRHAEQADAGPVHDPECGWRMPCSRSARVKRGLVSRAGLMSSRCVTPAR